MHEILGLLTTHTSLGSKEVLRMAAVSTTWRKALSCELGHIKAAASVTGQVVVHQRQEGQVGSVHSFMLVMDHSSVHLFSQLLRLAYIDAPCFMGLWEPLAWRYARKWSETSSEHSSWSLAIPRVATARVQLVHILASFSWLQVRASMSAQQHLVTPGLFTRLAPYRGCPWGADTNVRDSQGSIWLVITLAQVCLASGEFYMGFCPYAPLAQR